MATSISKSLSRQAADSFVRNFNTESGGYYTLFLGGDNGSQVSKTANLDSPDVQSAVSEHTTFFRTIKNSEIQMVVPRYDYKTKRAYFHYQSSGQPSGEEQCYVYNTTNRTVYLCVSDNIDNRYDLRGRVISSYAPTHTEGYKTYPDGYTWLVLYKVDWKLSQFLTKKYLPVPAAVSDSVLGPEIPGVDLSKSASDDSNASRFCGKNKTECGSCCFFHKRPWTDNVSGATYDAGDLYQSLNTKCYECIELAGRLDLDYSFIAGSTGSTGDCHPCSVTKCPCSKPILDRIATIRDSKYMSSADNAKTQANLNSFVKDGSLLSATIDLKDVTGRKKLVSSENPEVSIRSSTGESVKIKLLTTKDGSNNNMVYGISIINRGEGYVDHTKTALNNIDGDLDLSTKVTLNFEKVDNVINPQEILNAHCVMFNISMTTDEVKDITNQTHFDFFGFSKDAKQVDLSGNVTPIGSTTPTGIATFQRATHKITVAKLIGQTKNAFGESYGVEETSKISGSSNDKSKVQVPSKAGAPKGEMQISSLIPNSAAPSTRLDLELYPKARRKVGDDRTELLSLSFITNQADPDTHNIVTSAELSPVVDTGKAIHTGTNLNFNMPPHGQNSILRMRVTKCF